MKRRRSWIKWVAIGVVSVGLGVLPVCGDAPTHVGKVGLLRDLVYDGAPWETIQRAYQAWRADPMDGVDVPDRLYWQSRAAFYMGLGLRQRHRDRESTPFFEDGLEAARKSVALVPTAEGWRMQAECLGHLCECKGKLFLLTNGLKVMDYARRALALDEANIAARRLMVARTVHAPAIYGGDGPKGVREMRALMDRPEMRSHQLEKDTVFNIYYDMAFALRRAGKSADASIWLAQALELYPANPVARALRASIRDNP